MIPGKDLKTGDILHCRGKGLLSRLILKFTKGIYSHTAVVVEIWGQKYVVGAQNNGVNPRLFSEWLSEFNYDYAVSRPLYSWFDKKEICKKIFSKVGVTKYDYKALILYQPIYLLTGKWLGKHSKADDRFYCSEFVGWVYSLKGWPELSPQALYRLISEDKNFKTIE